MKVEAETEDEVGGGAEVGGVGGVQLEVEGEVGGG